MQTKTRIQSQLSYEGPKSQKMSCLWFEWKPIFWNGSCSSKCMKVKRVHLKQLGFGEKIHLSYEMRAQKIKKWVVSDLNGNMFFGMADDLLNVWKWNGSIWGNFVLGQKFTSVMRWVPMKSKGQRPKLPCASSNATRLTALVELSRVESSVYLL